MAGKTTGATIAFVAVALLVMSVSVTTVDGENIGYGPIKKDNPEDPNVPADPNNPYNRNCEKAERLS
ncbi:hypothetical protein M569_00839 [Genlisea aurea]|uniref:Uncharacterized protein n=1 Tax=Genlisea aurea TaxID=192259 RepID=S8D946_9LAMI|nr:hypothetical protein M569_00839 [Genlisea aurea]